MIYSVWQSYTNRLYAHEWYKLFSTGDSRSALNWPGRFSNLGAVDIYNFYSSGEECLRDYPDDPPADVLSAIPSQIWSALKGATGSFVWCWQEKAKGRSVGNNEIGSNHGGWSFNDLAYNTNDPFSILLPPLSSGLAADLSDAELIAAPFFNFASYPIYPEIFTNDLALLGAGGSSYAEANRNRILADAIPALTLPIGANPIPAFTSIDRNFNMQALYENGWPEDRLDTSETNNWHHSDFKNVAFTFTYRFYTNLVYFGNLQ